MKKQIIFFCDSLKWARIIGMNKKSEALGRNPLASVFHLFEKQSTMIGTLASPSGAFVESAEFLALVYFIWQYPVEFGAQMSCIRFYGLCM